ncbi:MAG: bifunctional DNA-formamidopyrimidine glycosylase/DNA-(apurinic or apyrimidinic site) lyase [Dehalococcoidales bacterium]|nr:bifunctional DNA-formamidopyrimidine glycosylase/DNA-(apurinic or apyrimidinic site) lyase [Dehalococcoidales bacterium]
MPELPEVETVKNEIEPHIIGRTITGVTLLWAGEVRSPSPEEFVKRITGKKIKAINRYGKYLVSTLTGGEFLVIHLKMTGALIIGEGEAPKHTRVILHLDNGKNIYFRDPRKFGVMKLIKDPAEITDKLGPEPLEKDFTVAVFAARLKGRKAPIKAVLLDQKFLAGVGNMYADEALYEARIHPEKIAEKLSQPEVKRLHGAIIHVLRAGLASKGASIVNYMRPDGSSGTAHLFFKVAHAQQKSCGVCGGKVERIVVRGRGTYYCPSCQKK